MRIYKLLFLVIVFSCSSCKWNSNEHVEYLSIIKSDFELYKPATDCSATLILFGGFGEDPERIKKEFKILEIAKKNKLAVVLTNYGSHLWLEENDKHEIASKIQSIFKNYELNTSNIFIGGFSSGGALSLLLCDFIVEHKEYSFEPKGVFAIDSPVDLEGNYNSCLKAIERNFADPAIKEGEYLINLFDKELGNPKDNIGTYEEHAVFTLSSRNISNLRHLRDTKIRLYTEPDLDWWMTHRKAPYQELNAYFLKNLFFELTNKGFRNIEYIESEDQGFRANGDRHPHSWSIVDKDELMHWILNQK